MNLIEIKHSFLSSGFAYVSWKHNDDKVVAFERGGLVFIINFHPTKSFPDYKIGVEIPGMFVILTIFCFFNLNFRYKLALNSDDEKFGGHNRLNKNQEYQTYHEVYAGRANHILVYIPSRVAIVLEKIN